MRLSLRLSLHLVADDAIPSDLRANGICCYRGQVNTWTECTNLSVSTERLMRIITFYRKTFWKVLRWGVRIKLFSVHSRRSNVFGWYMILVVQPSKNAFQLPPLPPLYPLFQYITPPPPHTHTHTHSAAKKLMDCGSGSNNMEKSLSKNTLIDLWSIGLWYTPTVLGIRKTKTNCFTSHN